MQGDWVAPLRKTVYKITLDRFVLRCFMMRSLFGVFLSLCFLVSTTYSQSNPCSLSDHSEYTKKIKEFTTESFFSTELVDHLPLSSCVPAPDVSLHHIVGAPDVLDYTRDINAYFRLLAGKSPRVKVWSIGMSEEGREMLVAAVSDEANLAKLDRYKEITARLADPRGLSDADAQKLIAEGKPMYWADGSIHSPETGSPEMLMELAYRLAVEDTPFIQKIRRDPIVISEWQEMAYHEIEEMTKRGVIGVWTHGFYDGWAPNYLLSIANNHNSIGRFYETFGNGGADTRVRTLRPPDTSREWYRPNPPLPKVKWSARDNINMQESAILFGMNNLASNGQKFLDNFYLKSKRAVAKARTEGPAAWVFPADDPRPAEQTSLLNLLQLQGVEVHRLEKELHIPAAAGAQESAGDKEKDKEKSPEKSDSAAKPKEEKKPTETVIPAGSYVVRMDQPYSRLADMALDTQYYSPRDPRSYDDTGWTLGALRNVKTTRVTDLSILSAAMQKMGRIDPPGGIEGQGKTLLIQHNTDNTLATLRFRLPSVPMEAAEDSFEADGIKFKAGSFIIRNADRSQLEKAAKDLEIKLHSTDATLSVKTHPLATPRIALVHNWQNTQNDGWFRIPMEELKVPYTYVADTWLRENQNLRDKFDVIILPPMGGGGPAGLSAVLRGLPMRGDPRPWKNSAETPNFVAPGLDSTDDIRGGLGYQGLANLERFVREGGLLIAVQTSASLPVAGGMTEMVNVSDARAMQAPGSVVLSTIDDKQSPITYRYDEKLYVYSRAGPVITLGGNFGGPGGGLDEGAGGSARSSGRGTATDPDIIQARSYEPPEKPVKRTPREQELYVPEDLPDFARSAIPPKDQQPRVVLRFAAEKDLLLSGMITGGNEIAEKPAVVDVPHGKGHVVLFANNPMWRGETMGSYFLVFNAMLNFDHLDAGSAATTSK